MVEELLSKLEAIGIRFREVEKSIGDPELIADNKAYRDAMREYRRLEPIANHASLCRGVWDDYMQAKEWASSDDDEFRQMGKDEIPVLQEKIEELSQQAREMLLPRDEADDRDVVLEVRAGTGGDEAAIFAGELLRMYLRHVESKGWKHTMVSSSEGTAGGFKEAVARLSGDGVYGWLKFESGVHRVQRVPATESQGRVHTSAATIAILPIAEDVDVELKISDLRRDTFRASGAGGQHVNKTESAVRLTHIPTGIVVECQDGRSQHANLEHAMEVMRTKLFEQERAKQEEERSENRKKLVSTGDRSAKIRTYNFPQGRVTDHRIGFTSHALPAIIGGDLTEVIEALHLAEKIELLKNL
ncbi:MAG: peptide chain release factor 1 [Crocinitomicaceae bacterium]|nr:peptide chain release factor 1 [Crocinitomicaceae bacterium]